MGSMRQVYYDLFSKVYDFVIRLHSSDREGSLRRFNTKKTHLSEGGRALDPCTGTGSVAVELAKQVGEYGLVVGLDFSWGMIEKAKDKSKRLNLKQLYLIQANASQLPF
jgi:ubiquinone/menaquinone biosynthesis C-methylase UbiE